MQALRTYYDLEALSSSGDLHHAARWRLIQGILDGDVEGALEPMTITHPVYVGGTLTYQFPNEGLTPNIGLDGRFSSDYKHFRSWRYFTEAMPLLDELRELSEVGQLLLCARHKPSDLSKKILSPLLLVATKSSGNLRRWSASHSNLTSLEFFKRAHLLNSEWLKTIGETK